MSVQQGPASSHGSGAVHIDRAGEVLTFTLDNPERDNEITGAMFEAMLAVLREEAAAPRARVLRLRARGRAFCVGRERAGQGVAAIRTEAARLVGFKQMLRATPLISIAEIQGDAFGFGCGLAILCDFALAAEHALLAFPEMRAGLPPAAIMAYLGEYVLPRHAFPLVLFGEPFSARRALEIGLVSEVVADAAHVVAAADTLTQRILQLDPASTRACKDLFQTMLQNSFESNCRLAVEALTICSATMLQR
ncbi:enoyl-CoA hydratase/isomerase family protein [bacterium]|nr:MAG: enoyl-CoA hydratase/isomerase family protein [bacterium]